MYLKRYLNDNRKNLPWRSNQQRVPAVDRRSRQSPSASFDGSSWISRRPLMMGRVGRGPTTSRLWADSIPFVTAYARW